MFDLETNYDIEELNSNFDLDNVEGFGVRSETKLFRPRLMCQNFKQILTMEFLSL